MTWNKPPSEFKKAVRGDINTQARRIGLKILRALTVVSPVDTGRFKANWVVGIKKRVFATTEETDKGGGPTFAKGEKRLARKRLGEKIHISNNLPYAGLLNDGHSGQAPANFVQAAITRALK